MNPTKEMIRQKKLNGSTGGATKQTEQPKNKTEQNMKEFTFELVTSKNLEVGDIVNLKSGSPKMTVNSICSDGDIWCMWFVECECKQQHFKSDALEKVPSKKVPSKIKLSIDDIEALGM
jgi:uncharacterized protein YodC (DUF2158 family)